MKYLVYLSVRTLWMPADQIKKNNQNFLFCSNLPVLEYIN